MTNWLMALTGVIIVTACAETLLPSGKIKNACKTVFALVCLAVFITPIAYLKDYDFDFSSATSVAVDKDYVEYTAEYFKKLYSDEIIKLLEKEGVEVEWCEVEGDLENGNFLLKKIFVKLKNSVITEGDEHIISIEEVTDLLSASLSVTEDAIVIYGY